MQPSYRDEVERRTWQNPEVVLADAGIKAGDIFIDLACGFGFFALPAARMVGSQGIVCGLDIDEEALKELREKALRGGLRNLRLTQAAAEDVVLCEECADVVFIGIALHDFNDPLKVLQNARRTLKKDGRLVNLDWKKERTPFGPPVGIRFSQEEAVSVVEKAGFSVVSVKDSGLYHYVIVASLRSSVP